MGFSLYLSVDDFSTLSGIEADNWRLPAWRSELIEIIIFNAQVALSYLLQVKSNITANVYGTVAARDAAVCIV